jgi:beta-galactosidase
MKKSGQPVWFELVDAEEGIVLIENNHHFKNLNELAGSWALQVNGEVVRQGALNLDLPAQQSREFKIPFEPLDKTGETMLLISFKLKENAPWAIAGHEVAWEQFLLPAPLKIHQTNNPAGQIRVEEKDAFIQISGELFNHTMDKRTGQLSSLQYQGKEYLEQGPEFMVWRAPTANDVDPWGSYTFFGSNVTPGYGRSIDNQLRTLGLRDMKVEVDDLQVIRGGDKVVLHIHAWSLTSLPVSSGWGSRNSAFERNETWVFLADGTIELEQEITPHGVMPEMLQRKGLQFLLPKEYHQVEWYGRGPFESYPDRKTGAKIGIYSSDANKMYEPYIIPQEYGNRSDVRWVKVQNDQGNGLLFEGEVPVNFSLHKFSTDNLSRAVYTYQLEEASHTILNLDYEVAGVGGTAIRQLQQYRLKPDGGTYRLKIKPF